ncbi:MAG: tetratricopeptide repeat protein [Spirulina sp. SIO3F2]|nr:tetratricopeptide repeat protein [Spirulina sp. SIO3F2]
MPPTLPGLNSAYAQLHDVLTAGLRRQVLIGVCASAQQAAAFNARLQLDVSQRGGQLLPVVWPPQQPQLLQAIAQVWLQNPEPFQGDIPPTLVLPEIISLTHASATVQQRFLRQLRALVNHIPEWNFNLLLWVNAPWLAQLQQAAPEFWRWHTGVFWFAAAPELSPAASGTVTLQGRWEQDETQSTTMMLDPNVANTVAIPINQTSPPPLATALQQYRTRLAQGDHTLTTLNQAIYTAQAMLQQGLVDTPEHLNDLGNFYWLRSRHPEQPETPAPDLLQALHHYEQALTRIGDPQTAPQTYAMIQNNLGAAYGDLAQQSEPIANLQRAIQAYETSLQYRTATAEPGKYSATQNNLGTAYWYLSQHQDPEVNLKAAIAAYDRACAIYEQQQDWPNWAMLQNNLGTTHWQLTQHSQDPRHLIAAIAAYQNSLRYRTRDQAPAAYAATQNNIAAAYWHLASQPEQASEQVQIALREAIAAYQAATEVALKLSLQDPPQFVSFDFLAAYHNLGVVQYQLATETRFALPQAEQQQHLYAAVTAYSQALQFLTPDTDSFTATLMGLVQTIRACYELGGISGQNEALQQVPGGLLPHLLPQLKT